MSDETYEYNPDSFDSGPVDDEQPMSLKDAAAEVQRQEKRVARYSKAAEVQGERVEKLREKATNAESVLTDALEELNVAKARMSEAKAVLDKALNS